MPPLDTQRTERWIRAVAAGYGYAVGDITYILCSDERILEVNRRFLGHDYYTDVITFDYSSLGRISGDIYISLDTVRSNAAQYVDTLHDDVFLYELHRIIIHGVLHLTGQGDKTPEAKTIMTLKEVKALVLLN